jgi:iron-sulfur cluster repair protein YtfE (RIC family)
MLVVDELDLTMTVKELMARDARTGPVFQRLGMDTCCGSGLAIADAARRVSVELETVLAELRAALSA